jgi:hypothetical protein
VHASIGRREKLGRNHRLSCEALKPRRLGGVARE